MKLSRSIVFTFGSSIITTGLLLLCAGSLATAQAQQCPSPAAPQCGLQLDCHCFASDDDGDGVSDFPCPEIEERQFLINLLQNHQDLILAWKDMTTPIPNSLPTLDCQPYELVAEVTGETYCGDHPDDNDEEEGYCAFLCAPGESDMYNYKLQTLPNLQAVGKGGGKKRKKVLTHHGACGVCSSAQDLVAFVNPLVALLSIACGQRFDGQNLGEVTDCMETNLGFTYDCAYLWASNTVNSILAGCENVCLAMYGGCLLDLQQNGPEKALECFALIPSNVQRPGSTTCELNACICCDNEASGETFNYYSGRTRRNSGILTSAPTPYGYFGLKRDCDSIANVAQLGAFCA